MRPKRPVYTPGHYYHFYNRGAHRQSVFQEDDNYIFVLRKLKKYCAELKIAMIAYCLLSNHYHFCVRQDGDNKAGLLPQRVFNSYGKAYNNRYDHSGTIFEGVYKVRWVDNNRYLRHLCRYIHANPVKDGFVLTLEEWPYSNYQEWVGLREGALVDRDFIVEMFAGDTAVYQEFVMDYLQTRQLPNELDCLD